MKLEDMTGFSWYLVNVKNLEVRRTKHPYEIMRIKIDGKWHVICRNKKNQITHFTFETAILFAHYKAIDIFPAVGNTEVFDDILDSTAYALQYADEQRKTEVAEAKAKRRKLYKLFLHISGSFVIIAGIAAFVSPVIQSMLLNPGAW